MATVIFEHSDHVGSDRLGEVLAEFGQHLRVLRLHHDEPVPVDLDDVDAVISCGGPQSANDDGLPWLAAEMAFVRDAVGAGLPVVGLCLGSQIVARALGGEVGALECGIELGWHPVDLTPTGREDPVHAGIAWRSVQPHWHREEVKALPPGGRVLARSERCAHQAWAVGLRTYGFQYHPEIFEDTLEVWAADDPDALDASGTTLERLRAATDEHYPAFARLARRLCETMALVLMPVDRRYHGLLKELHH